MFRLILTNDGNSVFTRIDDITRWSDDIIIIKHCTILNRNGKLINNGSYTEIKSSSLTLFIDIESEEEYTRVFNLILNRHE